MQCSRGWAAPEQLRITAATPAVDVFAWGCLLAHLASGIHPFASQSEEEWILRLQSAQPDLCALPADLDEVIRASLRRDPRDRPSAADLVRICQAHDERYTRSTRPETTLSATTRNPSMMSRQVPRPVGRPRRGRCTCQNRGRPRGTGGGGESRICLRAPVSTQLSRLRSTVDSRQPATR